MVQIALSISKIPMILRLYTGLLTGSQNEAGPQRWARKKAPTASGSSTDRTNHHLIFVSPWRSLMRHSDIRTTMNVYGDVVTDEMSQAHAKVVSIALNRQVIAS